MVGSDLHATLFSDSGVCEGVMGSDLHATGQGLLGSEGSCIGGRRGTARLGDSAWKFLVRGSAWESQGVRAAFRLGGLLGVQVDLLLGCSGL